MWRKLLALGIRGWADLVAAQLRIIQAVLIVTLRRRGTLVAPGARRGSGQDSRTPAPSPTGDPDRVEELVTAMDRAARLGLFRPKCLARSIALQRLLEANGIRGSIVRFGVRMRRGGFEGHAWVEWDGAPLGEDRAFIETFTEMDDLSLVPPSGLS
jgi:hypothetical protein